MKIFTEKGFREELVKRQKEQEKKEYMIHKIKKIEEDIEQLRIEIINIKAATQKWRGEK